MALHHTAVTLVLMAALVLVKPVTSASQGLYRWTDEQGQSHITDNPNQVPERFRPKPPPPDPRVVTRDAITALKSLAVPVSEEPPVHEDYMRQLGETRGAVDRAVAALPGGPLRAALTAAMGCYGEAAELWDNQLKVRRGIDLPLNLMVIRSGWSCGAEKTGEAERLSAERSSR